MSGKVKTVQEYLKELKETKKDKPGQIKEALEIYIDLWNKVIENGIVTPADDMSTALSKIDKRGGLYEAASD